MPIRSLTEGERGGWFVGASPSVPGSSGFRGCRGRGGAVTQRCGTGRRSPPGPGFRALKPQVPRSSAATASRAFRNLGGSPPCFCGASVGLLVSPKPVTPDLCFPGPGFYLLLLPLFSPCILKKSFCFGVSGSLGQSEGRRLVDHFSLGVGIHSLVLHLHREAACAPRAYVHGAQSRKRRPWGKWPSTGPGTQSTPSHCETLYYRSMSMRFCSIALSHASTPLTL